MIDKKFEPRWAEEISKHFDPAKFSLLGGKIAQLRGKYHIYPEKSEVFRAFELTPYEKVKVVLIGQD